MNWRWLSRKRKPVDAQECPLATSTKRNPTQTRWTIPDGAEGMVIVDTAGVKGYVYTSGLVKKPKTLMIEARLPDGRRLTVIGGATAIISFSGRERTFIEASKGLTTEGNHLDQVMLTDNPTQVPLNSAYLTQVVFGNIIRRYYSARPLEICGQQEIMISDPEDSLYIQESGVRAVCLELPVVSISSNLNLQVLSEEMRS